MGIDLEEKVIKPPLINVKSGKIFRPSRAFLHKSLLQPIVAILIIWMMVTIALVAFAFAAPIMEPENFSYFAQTFVTWFGPVSFWTFVINLVWFVPIMLYVPFYYKSIEFSVKAKTGETMPEVYVKKGVLTITRKHVPFRTKRK